jgi:butyryl-CoA dehydrogenase
MPASRLGLKPSNAMLLGEDHLAVQDAVRAYVQERIAPQAARWDKEHHFPRAELHGLAGLGCYGVAVPSAYDGAGLDYLALAIILEEIGAGDGATSTIVSVNNCPVCSILMAFANEEQKQRFLKPLARGDMLGAFCLTEPHVGSEAGGLKTSAQRDGDHYLLNGVKQFITSGKNGDVAIVMAVTDKAAGKKGISAFIVPTSTPGYQVARIEDKMGQHASDTAQIVFDNCRVPAANRLADEGMGLKIALSGLEGGRIGIASQSLGMARAAFEAALAYSKERKAFGQAIFEHQAVQFKLAEMATQIEAARQLIWHAAALKDAGKPCLKEAAMAKLNASEMAERVCSAAIQIFGGYGYVSDFPVERIYRDVRVCQIYEGTSEVQKILIGRALV